MIQFDYYFSDGLKPASRQILKWSEKRQKQMIFCFDAIVLAFFWMENWFVFNWNQCMFIDLHLNILYE